MKIKILIHILILAMSLASPFMLRAEAIGGKDTIKAYLSALE